jgi:hypothetical protein
VEKGCILLERKMESGTSFSVGLQEHMQNTAGRATTLVIGWLGGYFYHGDLQWWLVALTMFFSVLLLGTLIDYALRAYKIPSHKYEDGKSSAA